MFGVRHLSIKLVGLQKNTQLLHKSPEAHKFYFANIKKVQKCIDKRFSYCYSKTAQIAQDWQNCISATAGKNEQGEGTAFSNQSRRW
jgi:hypothetical protein